MRSIRIALAAIAVTASLSVTGLASAGMSTAPGRGHAHADSHTTLTGDIAAARLATAMYVTNLEAARADGYQIITRMIPDMGYHFLNPKVTGFDVRKPPIRVYEHHGSTCCTSGSGTRIRPGCIWG
jgi:hypothetical protein